MDCIYVITLNADGEQHEIECRVDDLIGAWYASISMPTNDDTVVSCVLNGTLNLYVETFGELMGILTGDCK